MIARRSGHKFLTDPQLILVTSATHQIHASVFEPAPTACRLQVGLGGSFASYHQETANTRVAKEVSTSFPWHRQERATDGESQPRPWQPVASGEEGVISSGAHLYRQHCYLSVPSIAVCTLLAPHCFHRFLSQSIVVYETAQMWRRMPAHQRLSEPCALTNFMTILRSASTSTVIWTEMTSAMDHADPVPEQALL